jgi:oxygen-independent coproporphyrinogen III oxidase
VFVHLPLGESASARYIDYLEKELALTAPLLGADRKIRELHWGGDTPTFLTRDEMSGLMGALDACFQRDARTQCSIEVDPRRTEPGTMKSLAALGFNRVSIEVQDFDPACVLEEARECGFRSVSFDLVYGWPKQTLDSFNRTLDKALRLNPDRIALCSYAHRRKLFKPQRRIAEAELPSPESNLQIMTLAIGRLVRAGYLYIGMDYFARPTDELTVAQALGQLKRSFQGYSTHQGDLVGLGVSAIGQIGPTYYQNLKDLDEYYAALDAGRLPVMRGVELTADDLVRRAVIQALTCHFRVSIESIELSYLIDFRKYFAAELADLRKLVDEGLIELAPDWIIVTPKGRLLVRTLCMVFDRYLRERRERASYSKVI